MKIFKTLAFLIAWLFAGIAIFYGLIFMSKNKTFEFERWGVFVIIGIESIFAAYIIFKKWKPFTTKSIHSMVIKVLAFLLLVAIEILSIALVLIFIIFKYGE